MPRTSYLFLYLPAAVQAYTTFDTTCSTPNFTTSFVSSPDTRGTLDILWSCLFTIFACTWTIQHLNIPEQRNGRDPGWRGDLKWQLKGFWRSTKWMLTTIVTPEILLTKAFTDLLVARNDLRSLKIFAAEDGVSWTLTHTMFANMGGFVIRSDVNGANPTLGDTGQNSQAEHNDQKNTVAASSHVSPNGDARLFETSHIPVADSKIHPKSPSPSSKLKYDSLVYLDPLHLTAEELIIFRRRGILKLPQVTREEIDDKSKGDKFVRAIAVFQTVWIIVQIVVRASRDLAISQLEIVVLAFAACAAIIYLLNWPKPKGVNVPFTLIQYPGRVPAEILQIVDKRRGTGHIIPKFLGLPIYVPSPSSRVGNDQEREGDMQAYFFFAFLVCSMLFGGLHIIAWNFSFPTRIEKIFWRVASIWCTTFLFVMLGMAVSFPLEFEYGQKIIRWTASLFSILYILARMFLLAECFRTLCFLPPDAYFSTWASNIPHLA